MNKVIFKNMSIIMKVKRVSYKYIPKQSRIETKKITD